MIKIAKKADCSGCHACVNICPKNCIVMNADDEGFLYPTVDLSKCVKCGLCKQVCHHGHIVEEHNQPEAYACYSTQEPVRMRSSSGGMFTSFAEEIIERGGAVFGAAFDENLTVQHICVTQKRDLEKLRGSKYLQSRIGNTYAEAKKLLQSGCPVFFTGTPCQIGGLKLYLGKQYDNLYTADVICHGAPSPKVWQLYLKQIEVRHQAKVDKSKPPFFRSKTQGWTGYSLVIHLEDGRQYSKPFWEDSYLGAFINDLTLRPSCYHCDFKSLSRNSDITMADFWGVDGLMPKMFDNKGTSLILLNSAKGKELFDCVKETVICQQADFKEAINRNPSAHKSSPCPFKRKRFLKDVSSENFESLYRACKDKGRLERLYHKFHRLLTILLKKR